MAAEINHFISWVLNPFQVGLVMLLLGGVWLVVRKDRDQRLGGGLMIALGVWFWVWSTPMLYYWLGDSLERGFPPMRVEELVKSADGPIVGIHILGGGMAVNTNECVYPEIEGGADRVWHGARLWHRLHVPVFCSGGGVRESTVPLLKDLGVPEDQIVIIDQAKNTEDEARLVGEIVGVGSGRKEEVGVGSGSGRKEEVGVGSGSGNSNVPLQLISPTSKPKVALVTSAWHMRRAKFLFERQGAYEVVPAPCDHEETMFMGRRHEWNLMDFVPNSDSFVRNGVLFKEHFAYWCYRVKYWWRDRP